MRNSKRNWLDTKFVMARFKREALWRQGFKCYYCNEPIRKGRETGDHLDPKRIGGKMERANIVACCMKCNQAKAGMSAIQYTYLQFLFGDRYLKALNHFAFIHHKGWVKDIDRATSASGGRFDVALFNSEVIRQR